MSWSNIFISYRMDKTVDVRFHFLGEFQRRNYVGGKTHMITRVDVDLFSYTVLTEFVKDYLNFSEIGGIYVMSNKGGWKLILDDKDVAEFMEVCADEEEIHFYIDNTVDKDIEPVRQMQPHIIIRPRKTIIQGINVALIYITLSCTCVMTMKFTTLIFVVTGSAKKPAKRKYTTTNLLLQQHKMITRSSPRLSKGNKISPFPGLITSKQDVAMNDKGTARRKLHLDNQTDDDADIGDNNVDIEVHLTYLSTSCITEFNTVPYLFFIFLSSCSCHHHQEHQC